MRSNSVTSASSTSSRASGSGSAPTKATAAAAPVSEPTEPQLQLFVKSASGETFPLTLPSSTPLGTLRRLIALRTNLPESELRLLHAGRPLASLAAPLSTLDLPADATLDIAPPASSETLAMPATATPSKATPAAKPAASSAASRRPRCHFKACGAAAQRIVGDCGFCAGHFCGKHRMLESHACPKLEACKAEEKERNREKLERERTVAIRGI